MIILILLGVFGIISFLGGSAMVLRAFYEDIGEAAGTIIIGGLAILLIASGTAMICSITMLGGR